MASFGGSSIARFSLGSDGYPTYQGCYSSLGGTPCTDLPGTPLNNPFSLAVSSDGGDLYAAGNFSSTIVHFQIGAGGSLTYDACKSSVARDQCEGLPIAAINGASDVVVSPNGSNVYVVAGNSQGLARFTTDSAGHLSFADCLSTTPGNGCGLIPAGSMQTPNGLRAALSSDGSSLYVSNSANSSLFEFDVAQSGALGFRDCLSDAGDLSCADLPGSPLSGPSSFAPTPDGKELLVPSAGANGLVRFLTTPPSSPDSTPPETKVGKHPEKKTDKSAAKFTFSSNEAGTTFACALDKKDAKACTSPYKVKVKPGRHKLAIDSVDAAGNADPTPAVYRWKVTGKKHKKHHHH